MDTITKEYSEAYTKEYIIQRINKGEWVELQNELPNSLNVLDLFDPLVIEDIFEGINEEELREKFAYVLKTVYLLKYRPWLNDKIKFQTDKELEAFMNKAKAKATPDSVRKVFRYHSTGDREMVRNIVEQFYKSKVDMALIEISLFDHKIISDRNQHSSFVKALVDWGILEKPEKELKQLASSMGSKFEKIGVDNYKNWKGKDQKEEKRVAQDRTKCIDIGKIIDGYYPEK